MKFPVSTLLCLALVQQMASAAFQQSPAFVSPHRQRQQSVTALELTGSGIELEFSQIIGPVSVFIGGLLGTTFLPEKYGLYDDAKEELSSTTATVPAPTPAPEPAPEPAPAPAPAPAPVVKKVEKVVEKVEVPEPVEPPAVVADAGDKVAELRRGVAKTIDTNVPQNQLLKRSSEDKEETASTTTSSSSGESTTTSKGGKRRFLLRVAKKVVAPWRKWKNIK